MTQDSSQTAFKSQVMAIEPDWIDYNGHLNMAYYMVLFDRGSDEAFAHLGMGPDYAASRKFTTYTGEAHICYLREVHGAMPVVSVLQLLGHDAKKLHTFQELRHAEEGWVAATCEMVTLHVDMAGPKVAPFPDDIAANVAAMAARHAGLPQPERAGRRVGQRAS